MHQEVHFAGYAKKHPATTVIEPGSGWKKGCRRSIRPAGDESDRADDRFGPARDHFEPVAGHSELSAIISGLSAIISGLSTIISGAPMVETDAPSFISAGSDP